MECNTWGSWCQHVEGQQTLRATCGTFAVRTSVRQLSDALTYCNPEEAIGLRVVLGIGPARNFLGSPRPAIRARVEEDEACHIRESAVSKQRPQVTTAWCARR